MVRPQFRVPVDAFKRLFTVNCLPPQKESVSVPREYGMRENREVASQSKRISNESNEYKFPLSCSFFGYPPCNTERKRLSNKRKSNMSSDQISHRMTKLMKSSDDGIRSFAGYKSCWSSDTNHGVSHDQTTMNYIPCLPAPRIEATTLPPITCMMSNINPQVEVLAGNHNSAYHFDKHFANDLNSVYGCNLIMHEGCNHLNEQVEPSSREHNDTRHSMNRKVTPIYPQESNILGSHHHKDLCKEFEPMNTISEGSYQWPVDVVHLTESSGSLSHEGFHVESTSSHSVPENSLPNDSDGHFIDLRNHPGLLPNYAKEGDVDTTTYSNEIYSDLQALARSLEQMASDAENEVHRSRPHSSLSGASNLNCKWSRENLEVCESGDNSKGDSFEFQTVDRETLRELKVCNVTGVHSSEHAEVEETS